jgi:hypothetical protein
VTGPGISWTRAEGGPRWVMSKLGCEQFVHGAVERLRARSDHIGLILCIEQNIKYGKSWSLELSLHLS